MHFSMRDTLLKLLKFLFAGGLIYWMFSRGYLDVSEIANAFQPVYFIAFFILAGVNLILNHVRWVAFLRAQGFENGFVDTLPLSFIGLFFNFAIPGSIGGDIVKAYYIVQDNKDRKLQAATTILMDRVIGFYSMLGLAVLAVLFNWQTAMSSKALMTASIMIGIGFTGASLVLAAALSSRWKRYEKFLTILAKLPGGHLTLRLLNAIQSYRNNVRELAYGVLLSVGGQGSAILFMILTGHALGEHSIPLSAYFFAVPIGFILSAIPLAPAGIGVGQVAFLFLFKMYLGVETPVGQTGITIFQLCLLGWGLVGAYFYLLRRKPQQLGEVSSS